jgi:hypothetical protein
MFARKVRIEYELKGRRIAAPVQWLDNFAMRNFTNDPIFDNTLPVTDGLMEIGTRVPLDRLRDSMEDWFRRKNYLAKNEHLIVTEC